MGSLFNTLSISASGMAAQRARAEVLAENMANAETTRTAEGGPYRRKDLVFQTGAAEQPFSSVLEAEMSGGPTGVSVAEVLVDNSAPDRRYMPGHPDADADGYVAFPKVNPATEMVDLMGASRGYDANVASMSAVKDMIQRSIDLLR
jgi:flagellar basal-body rod protein FlgC